MPGATVNRNPNRRVVRAKMLSATVAALVAWQTPHLCRADDSTEGAERPIVAIENVSVVDVVQGRIAGPRTVLIVDGRIAAIGKPDAVALPPAAIRVDGRNRYLIPGLVDMHVHLFNNATRRPPNDLAFPLFVANGVTAVREMAAEPAQMPIITRWRAGVEQGDLIAPRVLAAGMPVPAESPDAVRRLVREAHAAGADFIKVFSQVRESHWRALLDEAPAQGMPVCGHVPAEVSLLTAAKAGQRTNEHLTQSYEACSAREKEFLAARQGLDGREAVKLRDAQEREVLESFDQRLCDRTARALAKTGQVQVPTLVLPHFEARDERVRFRDDPRWRHLRPDEQTRWEHYLEQEPALDKKLAAQRWDVSRRIVKALHAAGAPILAGTDAPMPLVYPGFSLHKELELLVESGLSPAEALRAATLGPAEFLGLSESTGSIAVGKRADLVLLDANPLRQISNTQRIRAVVLNGRLWRRTDLDALLDGAARDDSNGGTRID
ncbi:MAG: amidohydrolase family protein [Chthoniobacterales bacterium]|nr:amidohydrolase family protein [Chthoniobacterales bacterium]